MTQKPNLINNQMNQLFQDGDYDDLMTQIETDVTDETSDYDTSLAGDIDTLKLYFKREVSNKINNMGNTPSIINDDETRHGQNKTMNTSFLEEYFFLVFKSVVFLAIFVLVYFNLFYKTNTYIGSGLGIIDKM
tara:strand:- start:1539 stop:1937 length:399 start_codon:yes stop_codon:yes gene_type:complete